VNNVSVLLLGSETSQGFFFTLPHADHCVPIEREHERGWWFLTTVSIEVSVLGGVDGLVFTAGIGENSPEIRKRICQECSWLGMQLDNEANLQKHSRISTARSKISAR
jgi:hypothetical protein